MFCCVIFSGRPAGELLDLCSRSEILGDTKLWWLEKAVDFGLVKFNKQQRWVYFARILINLIIFSIIKRTCIWEMHFHSIVKTSTPHFLTSFIGGKDSIDKRRHSFARINYELSCSSSMFSKEICKWCCAVGSISSICAEKRRCEKEKNHKSIIISVEKVSPQFEKPRRWICNFLPREFIVSNNSLNCINISNNYARFFLDHLRQKIP